MRLHRILGPVVVGLLVASAIPSSATAAPRLPDTTAADVQAAPSAKALTASAEASAATSPLGAATSAVGTAAPSALAISSAELRFDTALITMTIDLGTVPRIGPDRWLAAQYSFNGSSTVDGMIVQGQLSESEAITTGAINRWGSPCATWTETNDTVVTMSVDAVCMGRPGIVSYSVVYGDFDAAATNPGAVVYEPNGRFSDPSAKSGGYWLLGEDGGVFTFGDAAFYGSTGNLKLNAPVVGMSGLADASGYRFAAADGGVFNYGAARHFGSMGGKPLNKPVVAMASSRSGNGYWLVASDGGIFSFGDAKFYGSTGNLRLNAPIVAMQPTRTGKGYWLVASDGGIFSFGDAKFYGSAGSWNLNMPIKSMSIAADGDGYYLLAEDGGVFTFGSRTRFRGSGVGRSLAVSSAMATCGEGYLMSDQIGGVYEMGNVHHFGDLVDMGIYPNAPIIDMKITR